VFEYKLSVRLFRVSLVKSEICGVNTGTYNNRSSTQVKAFFQILAKLLKTFHGLPFHGRRKKFYNIDTWLRGVEGPKPLPENIILTNTLINYKIFLVHYNININMDNKEKVRTT
jgi:hypothetical protein